MAGKELPTRGQVTWPSISTDAAERTQDICGVFQSPGLVPALDVAENTALPLILAGVSEQECADRVAEALDLVGGSELAAKLPEEL